ncbi:MAG: hypothetical protein H0Z33_11080 [Bacillaceae bacterium]|nr:hypothetical protein [Bacillaceae bacterium]
MPFVHPDVRVKRFVGYLEAALSRPLSGNEKKSLEWLAHTASWETCDLFEALFKELANKKLRRPFHIED